MIMMHKSDHDANTATVQIETTDGTLNQLSIPMDELAKLNNGQVAIRLLLVAIMTVCSIETCTFALSS